MQRQTDEEGQRPAVHLLLIAEVGGKPGKDKVEDEAVGHVHQAQGDDVAVRHEPTPERPAARPLHLDRGGRAASHDVGQLRGVDLPVLRRLIAKPPIPDGRPRQPDQAEERRRSIARAERALQGYQFVDQHRRQRRP